jgi:hypothetical protein
VEQGDVQKVKAIPGCDPESRRLEDADRPSSSDANNDAG